MCCCMPKFDQPRWKTELSGDTRDGTSVRSQLQGVHETIHEAYQGGRIRLADEQVRRGSFIRGILHDNCQD